MCEDFSFVDNPEFKSFVSQYSGSLTVRGEIFFENNWLTIW